MHIVQKPFASYAAKHSFKNASKHLLFGYVMYCSFFNRMVPAACTYTDGNSAAAIQYIREETQTFCVHPEFL